ncbi:MAG: hypothetical protein QXR92_03210 [Fervidicoccaceae archaeon]
MVEMKLRISHKLRESCRRHLISLYPGVEEYAGARRRLKILCILTATSLVMISIELAFRASAFPLLIPLLLFPILTALEISAAFVRKALLNERLEQELPFLVVASASFSRTGLELSELLEHVAKSSVFRGARMIGEKYIILSRLFGRNQALNFISKIISGKSRFLLSEYSVSLLIGTSVQFLRERAGDILKSSETMVDRAIQLRATIAMIAIVLYGLFPSILIGMAFIQSMSISESENSSGSLALLTMGLTSASLPAVLAAIPDYPLSMLVLLSQKASKIFRALFIIGLIALILPSVLLIYFPEESFSEFAVISAAISCILGIPSFFYPLLSIITSKVDLIAEEMLNHARVWRSLHLFRSAELERLERRDVKPWIAEFIAEMLEFFRGLGDCNPSIFETFVSFISESRRSAMRFTMSLVLLMIASIASPIMNAMIIRISPAPNSSLLLSGYVSTIAMGLIAGKLSIGKNMSTFLPSISAMLYIILAPL